MKTKYFEFVFAVLLLFVMIFNMVTFAYGEFGGELKNLPKGKLVTSVESWDKNKLLNIYKLELKGVSTAVRGEIVFKDGSSKNVYWALNETETNAVWVDKNAVYINGKQVNIYGTPYDSREQIVIPEASYKNLKNS